ncbi:hypothetical protein VTK56DRAFT_7498 [Thermocarpiscus australiensis]
MSSANSHAGLSYNVASLRRAGFPPPHNPTNKPSPSLPQHASPYQPQPYPPQQPPQSQYSHHLFAPNNPPHTPQVPNLASVQNAARPQQSQMPPALPGPRQRASAPRMQQQPTPPLSYLQQSLNQQPLSQQSLTQQSMAQQSLAQQSLNPRPMNPQQLSQPSLGQQSLGQPPLSQQLQQPISQPPMSQSMTQSMSQQSMSQPVQSVQSVQQNDSSILSQQSSTPRPPSQPSLPPAQQQMAPIQHVQKTQQIQQTVQQALQQAQQAVQQVQQVQQTQQAQQVQQARQQPAARQTESAEPMQGNQQDDDMDAGSHDESGEGETSSLEPKLIEGAPYVPRQPMGPMMSAPPEGGSFPTLEAIHKHVLNYCTSVGYAVVIGRSKKTVPGLKKVLFVCDRAGKPPRRVSPEMRKRKTTSRKCDCQFGFFAIEQRTQWTVRYRPNPIHLQHNHGPSESPLLHPAARKLDSKMVAEVKALKESGVGVTQTLEILKQNNPHVPLLPRDIYNARAAINRNPQKVASGLAENRAGIYSKPHPSSEERIRAELRRELAKAREDLQKLQEESKKEMEDLKAKLREKDKIIERFEQFIDICNQRVMVSLSNKEDSNRAGGTSTS